MYINKVEFFSSQKKDDRVLEALFNTISVNTNFLLSCSKFLQQFLPLFDDTK